MKVYRTEEAMFDFSIEHQVLDEILFAAIEGRTITLDEIMEKCEDDEVKEEVFNILVSMLNDKIISETANGLRLINKIEAMHKNGFYTEDMLSQVPEELTLFCLSDTAEEMLDNNSVEDVAEYLAESFLNNAAPGGNEIN